MQENADQNNFEYEHFLRSDSLWNAWKWTYACVSKVFPKVYLLNLDYLEKLLHVHVVKNKYWAN